MENVCWSKKDFFTGNVVNLGSKNFFVTYLPQSQKLQGEPLKTEDSSYKLSETICGYVELESQNELSSFLVNIYDR